MISHESKNTIMLFSFDTGEEGRNTGECCSSELCIDTSNGSLFVREWTTDVWAMRGRSFEYDWQWDKLNYLIQKSGESKFSGLNQNNWKEWLQEHGYTKAPGNPVQEEKDEC